jgi:hypothetical protein
MVSATAGGTASSSSDDEGFKWMEAAYNTLLMNKVMYQTPAAYMTEEQGAVQEIKFPRDVCRDKAGTCIDLAVFMSALAESTGLHSYIYIIPKHAFVVVELSSGRLLPIECTALTAGSTYFEAIKQGRENLRVSKNGPSYVLEIADLRDDGHIRCPELPALPADYLAINKFSAVDYRKWTKPSVINFWD